MLLTTYGSREEARRDIVDYIEMFSNSNRLQLSLGYVSPREFEESWLVEQEGLARCPKLSDQIKLK